MSTAHVSGGGGRGTGELPRVKDIKTASKTSVTQSGRSGRPVLKSAFASMTYDSDKPEETPEATEVRTKGPPEAAAIATGPQKCPAGERGRGRTQTSVFADFVEEREEEHKDAESCGSPSRTPIDLSKQCSMMHRLMESDKSDIDPRDVHKLLPGQLLSSESLDLNVDLLQKAIAIAAQTELQREHADRENKKSADMKSEQNKTDEASPQDEPTSPASAPSFEAGQLVQSSPRPPVPPKSHAHGVHPPRVDSQNAAPYARSAASPIPGWPSPPPHMVHHISPSLGLASLGARAPVSGGPYMDQRLPPLPVPVSGAYTLLNPSNPAVSMGPVPMPWGAFPPPQQIPKYPVPNHLPPPAHPVPLEAVPIGAQPPKAVRTPMCGMPVPISMHSQPPRPHSMSNVQGELRTSTPNGGTDGATTPDYDDGGSPTGSKDLNGRARRFRSVEAALAWCHVQHSQKQVPVVPKEDVKRLVEFQLSSGKPIRAPWYRPQKDEDEVDEDQIAVPIENGGHKDTQISPVQSPPSLGKPPRPSAAALPGQASERGEVLDGASSAPGLCKPPKSPTPVFRSPTQSARTSPSPPGRLNPMTLVHMLSPQSSGPHVPEMSPMSGCSTQMVAQAPLQTTVTRMMTPPPGNRCRPVPLPRRSATPPAQRSTNSPTQAGNHGGSGSPVKSKHSSEMRRHGTGFFVPAGLPA